MPLSGRSLAVAALLLAASACTGDFTSSVRRVALEVPVDTLVVARSRGIYLGTSYDRIDFQLPVVLRNRGASRARYDSCQIGIVTSSGEHVWSPVCALALREPTFLDPGDSLRLSLRVSASMLATGAADWNAATVDGAYRLWMSVYPGTGAADRAVVQSNAFALRERR